MRKKIILLICVLFSVSIFLYSEEVKISNDVKESIFDVIISDNSEEEICKIIKENKYSNTELNAVDANGYTPLYLAIDCGKRDVLELLLKKGAQKNKITNIKLRDNSGIKILRCSPVLYAAWKGDVECLSLLIDKGANVNVESDLVLPKSDGITYIRLLLPLDAAFYNRRNVNFGEIYDLLAHKMDMYHYHFSGKKWAYGKYKTYDLLKEYGLLKESTE